MNNITRNNYEEYFILYLDNELNTAQQQELTQFLQQNTDLQAELDMLSGTKLSVDEKVVFPDKDLLFAGKLLQQTTESEVSAQDSEIIMYLDAELTANDKKAFEQKLAVSPELQQQLALFAKTKLKAQASEVFPDKALLYKEEETKRRILPMYWLRMGVAAALLVTLGVGGFKWLNNPKEIDNNGLAGATIEKPVITPQNVSPVTTETVNETPVEEQALAQVDEATTNSTNTIHYTTGSTTQTVKPVNKTGGNGVQTAVTNTVGNNNGQPTNNLPTRAHNIDYTPANDGGLVNNTPDVKPLNNNTGTNNIVIPQVKNNNQASFASNNQFSFDEVIEVEEPENKKNKLRGFFRKVTRNFQKQTSIDMTNGDDQLLVAGFAFKM